MLLVDGDLLWESCLILEMGSGHIVVGVGRLSVVGFYCVGRRKIQNAYELDSPYSDLEEGDESSCQASVHGVSSVNAIYCYVRSCIFPSSSSLEPDKR